MGVFIVENTIMHSPETDEAKLCDIIRKQDTDITEMEESRVTINKSAKH